MLSVCKYVHVPREGSKCQAHSQRKEESILASCERKKMREGRYLLPCILYYSVVGGGGKEKAVSSLFIHCAKNVPFPSLVNSSLIFLLAHSFIAIFARSLYFLSLFSGSPFSFLLGPFSRQAPFSLSLSWSKWTVSSGVRGEHKRKQERKNADVIPHSSAFKVQEHFA